MATTLSKAVFGRREDPIVRKLMKLHAGKAWAAAGSGLWENVGAGVGLGFRAGLGIAYRTGSGVGLRRHGEAGKGGGTTRQNHTARDGRGPAGVGGSRQGAGPEYLSLATEITASVHLRE